MKHFRSYAISVGLIVCLLSCYRLLTLWNQPADAFWSPAHLALSMDATKDRLEVLAQGKPLAAAIEAKQVYIVANGVSVPLTVSDVGIRVNDYDRQRTMRIPAMMAFAAVAGGGFVLFLIGLLTPAISVLKPHGLVDLHLTA